MRFGKMIRVASGLVGLMLMAGITTGCGPSQAEKDLEARKEAAVNRAEMAANKAESAAGKADAAARQAADSAAKAQAAADKAEGMFHKGTRK